MLTKLISRNYRAFEELEIPLTKVNLFFGPNNSGKSAILSVINLLAQTLHSADRDVPLLLNGRFEDLGTYEDIVYKNEIERDVVLGLEFDREQQSESLRRGSESKTEMARFEVAFHYRKPRREIVVSSLKLSTAKDGILMATRVAKVSRSQVVEEVRDDFERVRTGPSSSGDVTLDHFIPELNRSLARVWYPSKHRSRAILYRNLGFSLWDFEKDLRNELENVEFIGPFRRNPERIYPFSGETPSSVGVHGDNAVGILVSDEFLQRRHKRDLVNKISQWFQKSGIAKAVEIVPISERHFEVRLTHFDTGENTNIADAGYGCSQILPILVAGYYLAKHNTLIIAQPEIHLHPRAEAEVGTFLCEVAKKNIQLFVETHGVHLILRLQSHVASGELSPEDVNVFCVYSDIKSGNKLCRRIPIGKDGFFEEEWPKGFFPERLEEAKRLAKFSV